MLEACQYSDDFPISIRIVNMNEDPLHYHHDIEFIFVLEGEIELKNGYCSYILREGDVFTNNAHEVHGLYNAGADNAIALIRVSNLFFTQYFPDLSKSCYRTYSADRHNRRSEQIRRKLLLILLHYFQQNMDYKYNCIKLMIQLIRQLNDDYNLFAFDGKVVVSISGQDNLTMERMSRIINYVYANHSEKITLQTIAKIEHLNEYYLSHIIKEFMGISFRDLLCFARVEWSEVYLLGTTMSVAAIAREIGFSTTSLYRKHFGQWFSLSPEEHREKYANSVKSETRQESSEVLKSNRAISAINRLLLPLQAQEDNVTTVQTQDKEISINRSTPIIKTLCPRIRLITTLEDYRVMDKKIYRYFSLFQCEEIVLLRFEGDDLFLLEKIKTTLIKNGLKVLIRDANPLDNLSSYGFDSFAGLLCVLRHYNLTLETPMEVPLRDFAPVKGILSGKPSLLTTCGIQKPAYYAYHVLTLLSGNLLLLGRNFFVVQPSEKSNEYIIVAFNYNDDIQKSCTGKASPYETFDSIQEYNGNMNININLEDLCGEYLITRFSMDSTIDIMHYLARMGFPETLDPLQAEFAKHYVTPRVEVSKETIKMGLNLNVSLNGASMQLIRIQPME